MNSVLLYDRFLFLDETKSILLFVSFQGTSTETFYSNLNRMFILLKELCYQNL